MGNTLGAATYCRGKGLKQGQSLDPDDLIEKMGDFMDQFKEITDAACEMSLPGDRRSTDRLAAFIVLQKEEMVHLAELHDRLLHVIVPDDPILAEKVAEEKKKRAEMMLSARNLTSDRGNVQLQAEHDNEQMQSMHSEITRIQLQIEKTGHTMQCVTHLQEDLAASSRREQILQELVRELPRGRNLEEAAEAFAEDRKSELAKVLRSMAITVPGEEASESTT
ncbi:uncharacterized protein F5Z01DRAFT_750217 [Emericellopsis atlantica]|uniref:Uncharacterized protein n=1 Tax=Emericellopsis atlantica TaxID=2614577 RepID=A0A9P7ZLH0_9HYPO|nr:uncharacterized protein F5Z01DRAFT_750217 [Emericellopsis atlantica]KAG9254303.1 hypothetical protein F5Z01DRAFT_750217 [Emericellopsis atlantica]